MSPVVYVAWRGDTPVYVGSTTDWRRRMREQGLMESARALVPAWSPQVTHTDVWFMADEAEARAVEVATIRALMPTHNATHTGAYGSTVLRRLRGEIPVPLAPRSQ